MKTLLPLILFISFSLFARSQITTPVIRANFGVDAELRANYYDGFVRQGNDDWFADGTAGNGRHVIDTNGAHAMAQRYLIDPSYRKLPFFRTMSVPQMSVVNNRLWIDAVYIRDYNGQAGGDSTAFVMSNKNGQSPAVWTGGITSVLDKNDIAEMMVHVRRAGPSKTDSLWFFGGLSLQGTTGNRYFDFELYQTDIFYTRSTGQFSNYGPDEGHTSWQFDAAGNVTKPGDVIFTAEYSSSSLTAIEARIWVHKSALTSVVPEAFEWIGNFDGATTSSVYGYANIRPKRAGAYYTGLQSARNTWAGPFKFINSSNAVVDTYDARQFMEFSVNLSLLGLDPITLLGGDACGLPFRRILVKTRSSTSFSSELKDFIGPFDFFKTPPVEALTDVPLYCGPLGVSELKVMNPLPSSVYTWSTPDGRFVYDSIGTMVVADMPGTYVVKQQLLDGCSSQSTDTVIITHDAACVPMRNGASGFRGQMVQQQARLQWAADLQQASFILQRSIDGKTFENITVLQSGNSNSYTYNDDVQQIAQPYLYYRLVTKNAAGQTAYSPIVRLQKTPQQAEAMVYPNPASSYVQVHIPAAQSKKVTLNVYTVGGSLVHTDGYNLSKGANTVTISNIGRWQPGIYLLSINDENNIQWLKFIVGAGGAAVQPR